MCKCWSQWLLIAVILAFSIMTLLSLSACGIKGPLYLPTEKQKQEALLKKETEKKAESPALQDTEK